ncbi:hypothetical protein SAMN05421749_102235 [Acinetobacter marinus]|uniref:Uncharacterized protein n=1 Tax=Acinetobacter marinus TaxID=281375 RepID=A0A1G6HH36_9GAMM|nr:hypothetical protein [Acinetobacter marinus]SDB93484.1 hypothetical protein SAMN05421749_102235 [Acinetobacter marinus]
MTGTSVSDKNLKLVIPFLMLCYHICLYLPAFKLSIMIGSGEGFGGLGTLIMGTLYLPFGLYSGNYGILAVCGNYIFFYFVARFFITPNYSSKFSVVLAILLIMSMILSFFDVFPVNYTSNGRIVAWGYGAFFWYFSLSAMSFLVLYRYFIKRTPHVSWFIFLFVFSFILSLGLRYYQYHYLADEYHKKYFFDSVWLMRIH